MTTWTSRLSAAAKAVRDEPLPHPYWPFKDSDIRSRASEFANHPVGSTLEAFQDEYLSCFVQRLDSKSDPRHPARASHVEFLAALSEAKGA